MPSVKPKLFIVFFFYKIVSLFFPLDLKFEKLARFFDKIKSFGNVMKVGF